MQTINIIALVVGGMFVCCMLYFLYKTKQPFKTAVGMTIAGVSLLLAINFLSMYTGVYIAVNPYTVGVSTVGGVPGLIALVVLPMFF